MENKLPLISVITTVYNTEKYVERCFESIFNQTYKNIEFIIVNNASEGNINEIVNKYRYIYPDFKIKLVELKENVGLFHGRLKGAEEATGDYIAFIDSDDRVSIDYYRMLIDKAINTSADIVVSSFVYEDEENCLTHDIYNPIKNFEFKLEGNEIFNTFINQEARSFYFNLVWNKIYSKNLWNKCKPYFYLNKNKIIMCDDIIYSFVFNKFSCKMVNVCNVEYYYFKHKEANSNANNNFKKFKSILKDIINVFNFCKEFLTKINWDRDDIFIKWKARYFRIWRDGIQGSKLSEVEKKYLIKYYKKGLGLANEYITEKDDTDSFFFTEKETFDDSLENIRKKIANPQFKYISFDIFDTLIVRNVWEPYDLFKFLNEKYNKLVNNNTYLNFSDIRSYCEHQARERAKLNGKMEINLDDIYKEIQFRYNFEKVLLEKIKKYELDLELKLCEKRKTVFELYKMAIFLGKKVICISDMYLPLEFIYLLLRKNGYTQIDKIYLSSNIGVCKNTSDLFKYVLDDLCLNNKEILHIGDNFSSDIKQAKKAGINGIYIQRTIDAFMFLSDNKTLKKSFINLFYKNIEITHNVTIFSNIGSRCLMAIIANKIMDNPFILKDNIFSKNPYFIGFFVLGMYIYGAANWILKECIEHKYEEVHFMSRDGFLIKKAFDILNRNNNIISNYFYSSRKALLPFLIKNNNDFLGLSFYIYPLDYSPKKIITIFKNSLVFNEEITNKKVIEKGFILEKYFSSKEEFDKFIMMFSKELFSYTEHKIYRNKFKCLLEKIVKKNSCTFDVGYSGRSESIFSSILGYSIDALYLYRNYDKSNINSRMFSFNIRSLFHYFPNINNEIFLELLISDTQNSLKKYILESDELQYCFDNNKQDFITTYMINIMHKGAIDFINKVNDIFNDVNKQLYFNEIDLSYPLEVWIKKSSVVDIPFLKYALFDDVLDRNIKQTVLNNKNILPENQYIFLSKIEKFLYYLSVDRGTLKFKVKEKLKNHLILTYLAKYSYKTARRIYRFWRNK